MVLPIVKLPAQVLRRPVTDVSFPLHKDVRRLIRDMLETVIKADGIGLAAPQVGQSLNLALIYLETSGIPVFPIINPKIVETSKQRVAIEEGCLSLPGLFGEVTRPKKIVIEYQDMHGKVQRLDDNGWIARVCQHEVDHLIGTLIIDKLDSVTQGQELLKIYSDRKG